MRCSAWLLWCVAWVRGGATENKDTITLIGTPCPATSHNTVRPSQVGGCMCNRRVSQEFTSRVLLFFTMGLTMLRGMRRNVVVKSPRAPQRRVRQASLVPRPHQYFDEGLSGRIRIVGVEAATLAVRREHALVV